LVLGSWADAVAGAAHPAFELNQDQLVRAINQGEVTHGAIAMAAVVEGEAKGVTTEAADFWITADHHIEGGSETGDAAATFGPAHGD
jgi:hypothetical protein